MNLIGLYASANRTEMFGKKMKEISSDQIHKLIKVVLIDDDLSLKNIEQCLNADSSIDIVGKFNNPLLAKGQICKEEVEIVFMDTHLPGMSGIQLASQLLRNKPELKIVFITAHVDYAVKAFELNAFDYIVKPATTARLMKSIERFRLKWTAISKS